YGILLVMATYNLFLFFFLRQREYLYYVLYNFSLLLFQFTIHGHTFQYLLPNQIWLANNLIPFFIGMNFVWTILFFQVYLDLEANFPRVNRALRTANYAFVALSLLGLCGFYSLSIRLLIVCTLATTFVSPLVTIALVRQGMRQAQLYMLAWAALIAGVVAYVLRTLGVLPSNWLSEWGIQIGASLEVVLLSLALADRINGMRSNLTTLNTQLSQNVSDLKLALEQAQAGTRAKLEFLATVSHELRTPLNAIINIPGGLLRDFKHSESASCAQCSSIFALEPGDAISAASVCPECSAQGTLTPEQVVEYHGQPEATERHLLHIERSGKHLLQMVNGILDFSKLEAGKVSISVSEVPVKALLLDAMEPLEELARRAGVKLSLELSDEDLLVHADGLRLKQVLINLLGNAIKFSDGRGSVQVRAEQTGSDCVFSVSDQGIGIAPQDRARVFQSFEQVHRGDTRKYGGTGLGLSICKTLVDMHGGEIWVESELG
ncbi:MAG TPA: 7TM diverse intracellular signaling domain-containing protein, partial [Polyangiales bacterium]|nr:7TM diverse intracellular signaling domain-containing protein [Polyangiales bacterium]